jgi:DNA-directed RNA polymerase subunit RPC12/RpoP
MERVSHACHHHDVNEGEPPFRELFVEVLRFQCPWCKTEMREIDDDGGVQCEQCGARSLPLAARKAIARTQR